jgi:hypothetical protein
MTDGNRVTPSIRENDSYQGVRFSNAAKQPSPVGMPEGLP